MQGLSKGQGVQLILCLLTTLLYFPWRPGLALVTSPLTPWVLQLTFGPSQVSLLQAGAQRPRRHLVKCTFCEEEVKGTICSVAKIHGLL